MKQNRPTNKPVLYRGGKSLIKPLTLTIWSICVLMKGWLLFLYHGLAVMRMQYKPNALTEHRKRELTVYLLSWESITLQVSYCKEGKNFEYLYAAVWKN